jgi:hypothetical protein
MAVSGSLANSGDFFVGKGSAGLLRGELDFLRVSRGTLADALTSIEELYAWQFAGPFLRAWDGSMRSTDGGVAGAVAP